MSMCIVTPHTPRQGASRVGDAMLHHGHDEGTRFGQIVETSPRVLVCELSVPSFGNPFFRLAYICKYIYIYNMYAHTVSLKQSILSRHWTHKGTLRSLYPLFDIETLQDDVSLQDDVIVPRPFCPRSTKQRFRYSFRTCSNKSCLTLRQRQRTCILV